MQTPRVKMGHESAFAAANAGKKAGTLFRTAKRNYQIKQQRRYINKIDLPGVQRRKRNVVVSDVTLFRATHGLITSR